MKANDMKTVAIYDQMMNAPISFFVLDGDYSHLDGVYINCTGNDEELVDLMHDSEGKMLQTLLYTFPVEEVKNGAIVIVVGFAP